MLIDTHCHILKCEYEDVDFIIKKFGNNIMIVSGYDDITNREVIDLVNKYPNVYGMLGFHPSEYKKFNVGELNYIRKNLSNPKIVGIGEIGLDYHYEIDSKSKQVEMFKQLLDLAEEKCIPVTIHSREAALDTMEILKDYNLKVTMHCYSYSLEVAKILLKRNYMFGIGGVITFKNSKNLVEVVKNIPIENILLETDSPYLTPEPFRGCKNDCSYLEYVAKKIAELKEISYESVVKITTENAIKQFDLNI